MTYYETIRTIQTPRFRVVLDCAPETDPDYSFDETGETQEKINSGEWGNYVFRVRAIHVITGIELATGYLGNSIYANPADFAREHIGARGRWGSYYRDMVSETISEARKTMQSLQTA